MTTPERGRDGLRLTRGERETLESYLVALWQCETERGYHEFADRVLAHVAEIKTGAALIAADDAREHPAMGDEEPCVCRDSEFCSCQQPPPGALIAAEIDRLSAEGTR